MDGLSTGMSSADCKSVAFRLWWFESTPIHHFCCFALKALSVMHRHGKADISVRFRVRAPLFSACVFVAASDVEPVSMDGLSTGMSSADCKSVAFRLWWFESTPIHHFCCFALKALSVMHRHGKADISVRFRVRAPLFSACVFVAASDVEPVSMDGLSTGMSSADCKSVAFRLWWFESTPIHHFCCFALKALSVMHRHGKADISVRFRVRAPLFSACVFVAASDVEPVSMDGLSTGMSSADCKSVAFRLWWFESTPIHHFCCFAFKALLAMHLLRTQENSVRFWV